MRRLVPGRLGGSVMPGGVATLPLCVRPRVGGRQVFRRRPLIGIPRSRLCGIKRKKRRHARQRDACGRIRGDDIHALDRLGPVGEGRDRVRPFVQQNAAEEQHQDKFFRKSNLSEDFKRSFQDKNLFTIRSTNHNSDSIFTAISLAICFASRSVTSPGVTKTLISLPA